MVTKPSSPLDLKAWSVPSDLRRQVKPRSARGRTAVVEGGLPQPHVVSGNARAASLVKLLRHPFIHSMLSPLDGVFLLRALSDGRP